MRNTALATSRPSANTARQPPKNAISSRESTGGSFEKSLISRNSSAGIAVEKTNLDNPSDTLFGQPAQRASAEPTNTSRNSGAVSARKWKKAAIGRDVEARR